MLLTRKAAFKSKPPTAELLSNRTTSPTLRPWLLSATDTTALPLVVENGFAPNTIILDAPFVES